MIDIESSQHNTDFVLFNLAPKKCVNSWSSVLSSIRDHIICSNKKFLSRISSYTELKFLGIYHELEGNHATGMLQ